MRRIILSILSGIFLFSIAFAKEFKPFLGEVTSDSINVRTDSTTSADIIIKLNRGVYIYVIGESFDWYKIKIPKLAASYIRKDLVSPLSGKTARIAKESVNIRLLPSESSPIIGKGKKDEVISILGEKENWYKIEPLDNSSGWIYKKFVKEIKEPKKIETASATSPQSIPISPQTTAQAADNSPMVIEGVVKPYGRVFKRLATHKIIKSDKTVFLLKGNKKTLDTLTYHKVRIWGKMLKETSPKYPIIEVDKIEALD